MIFKKTILVFVLLMLVTVGTANAVMYTFTGSVVGGSDDGEVASIRYVYTFEDAEPREGVIHFVAQADSDFSFDRDITNTQGDGEIESVVAWAFVRDQEQYIDNAVPGVPNYIGEFDFTGNPPRDNIHFAIAKSGAAVSFSSLGSVKALYR